MAFTHNNSILITDSAWRYVMSERLTIKDIARLSGVGKSTVSRVINKESGVKPETRARIEEIINQHNFAPSKSARAMRGQTDKVVAIIVSRLDSNAENQAVRAMLPLLYAQGYDPILLESQFEPERVREHLTVLSRRHVDGILLFGFTGLDESMLLPWREKIVVLAWEYEQLTSVRYDDSGAVTLLMNALIAKKHQHIAFVGVKLSDATTGGRRYDTYHTLCQKHQIIPRAALGELTFQSGYQLAQQVISEDTSAIICASDTIALGVSKYLQERSKNDVIVCGMGNNSLLEFLYPKTFSVDLGYAEGGRMAVQQLLSLQNTPQPGKHITVPCTLRSPN